MRTFRDQMGFVVTVPDVPKRIVSLVPSQTELICDLGREKELLGITKFCIHPETAYQTKVRVGGTKTPQLDTIRLLAPDLILANKEENERETLLELKKHFPVWISDIQTVAQATAMISEVGRLLNAEEKAHNLLTKIQHNFGQIQALSRSYRVAYFIWRKPYMTVSQHTFIHAMLTEMGFENVYAREADRYPHVTTDDLRARKPEIILLSSEPYPFGQKHFAELEAIFPDARIFLVDGEMFSWYGSRMAKAPKYFNTLAKQIENRL